ncbi:peptide-methionine (S)-S-oxide reductase MsrA [Actinocorallia lasiicapitis]
MRLGGHKCSSGAALAEAGGHGVLSTAVGYQGGYTPNPTYEEVCSGRTGHTEVVRVVFDPAVTSYEQLLKVFWENHDPTQGFRQGNDVGTQYRSAVYTHGEAQAKSAAASRDSFAPIVHAAAGRDITTEIAPAPDFFFAEDYHQQYLSDAKNPNGYCNIGPTRVHLSDPSTWGSCQTGIASTDDQPSNLGVSDGTQRGLSADRPSIPYAYGR